MQIFYVQILKSNWCETNFMYMNLMYKTLLIVTLSNFWKIIIV